MTDTKTDTTAARFADNVRTRREVLGKPQSALAQLMRDRGFDSWRQQTVAEVEGGNRQVRLDEAYALAGILGLTVDGLVRPAKLARQANDLLSAAADLLEAGRQATQWETERASAQRRTEKAIATAAGHEDALADELAVARRALGRAGRDL